MPPPPGLACIMHILHFSLASSFTLLFGFMNSHYLELHCGLRFDEIIWEHLFCELNVMKFVYYTEKYVQQKPSFVVV